MYFKQVLLLLLVLILFSCDFVSKENKYYRSQQAIDTIIDYSVVDTYPILKECSDCESLTEINLCFEGQLSAKLEEILSELNLVVSNPIQDTLIATIGIDNDNSLKLLSLSQSEELLNEIPDFETKFRSSLNQLQVVQSSTKRGVPVNSEFKLPIIINTN